ncbi:MAG: hypothetical protein SFY92_06105 [Verrucomicrobiae bacterium]|nr:hypothetical protein [Verrucomicrobiae bacterium]
MPTAPLETVPAAPVTHQVLVDAQTRLKPKTVARLCDWQYLERSLQRLLCAWGRELCEWDDKKTIHRMVWEQAECVRRLRERLSEFPGGNPDAAVGRKLETLANTVLRAPGLEDALDGVFANLLPSMITSYVVFSRSVNPVHDAPTVAMLHEICTIKEQHRLWYREYRRRHPHVTESAYRDRVQAALGDCGHFAEAVAVDENDAAEPCGKNTDFRLKAAHGIPAECEGHTVDLGRLGACMDREFTTSIEARRLFWMIGYLLEFNIPDDQMAWIWHSHFMPWGFHQDVSRHLWDESRHGDSGYARLKDFGLGLRDVGYGRYWTPPEKYAAPAGPKEMYEALYGIGMIAETAHFSVKQEAYQDFRDGGDMESAEMMLFDIIDETTHVQYAHRWLPLLAEKAGIDHSDYKERAARERAQKQEEWVRRTAESAVVMDDSNPDYVYYRGLLEKIRRQKPLSNAATCPVRSPKPM